MKQINQLISAAAIACAVLIAGPVLAQDNGKFTDEQLDAYADAAIEINAVVQDLRPMMEGKTQEEQDTLIEEANKQIALIIESQDNISSEEYDAIVEAIQEDEELKQRIYEILEAKVNGSGDDTE